MNKLLLSMAVVLGAGMILTASAAKAYQGDPSTTGPNCTAEQHEAISEALANRDYEAWVYLMQGKGRITEKITAENFDQFAQVHELMLAGDTEEANAIRVELGLGQGMQNRGVNGSGIRNGMGRGNK